MCGGPEGPTNPGRAPSSSPSSFGWVGEGVEVVVLLSVGALILENGCQNMNVTSNRAKIKSAKTFIPHLWEISPSYKMGRSRLYVAFTINNFILFLMYIAEIRSPKGEGFMV